MRRIDFNVPIYDWHLSVVTVYDKFDINAVQELFNELGIVDDDALDNVQEERFNGGETYVNAYKRCGLILIYKFDYIGTFHNVLNHEKRHLVDRIGNAHLIRDEKEAIAYLDGYISEQIYTKLDKLI